MEGSEGGAFCSVGDEVSWVSVIFIEGIGYFFVCRGGCIVEVYGAVWVVGDRKFIVK